MEKFTIRVGNYGDNVTTFTDGSLFDTEEQTKNILLPIKIDFKNDGFGDLVETIYREEKEKNINKVIDRETTKFSFAQYGTSNKTITTIKFKFSTGNTYSDNFYYAGFSEDEVVNKRNALTKSFFRLDFFDSPDEKTQNLMFSEFINIGLGTSSTSFSFDRLFWFKNDSVFTVNSTYRKFYFNVTFFNAKTGTTKKLINKDLTQTLSMEQYKNNPEWRFAEVRVLNPYNNLNLVGNKNKIFYIEPINGNNDNLITFSELKFTT